MTGEEEELTTWTLGGIKSAGMVLEGACATPDCNEFVRFDLDGLIAVSAPTGACRRRSRSAARSAASR